MHVRFWGVRGSIAVSGAPYIHTGGNTACVELRVGEERLILDGGTGLRGLGDTLGPGPHSLRLLFSHVHWDHIQGVPFFGPAFDPSVQLTIIGAERQSGTLRDALTRQMRPPQFPITLDMLRAQLGFQHLRSGQSWETGPFRITPLDLLHPDGVFGYRVEAEGKTVVYATDVEHGSEMDRRLVQLAEGADLLIHDAQFHDDEYTGADGGFGRRGWGHSTWEQAVEVAELASVERLALFHHDPRRIDDAVASIEFAARQRFGGAMAAREGRGVVL